MEDEGHPEWNSALEGVIKKEGEQAEALYWLHHHSNLLSRRRADWIQIPSIILATVTGFFSATSDLVPPIAIGAASVVVGILGTINSYFKFSQRAEGHRITALFYHKVYKTIETQLALPISQRVSAENFLRELRDEMARVGEAAPEVPEFVVGKFRTHFRDEVISKPIIANGLDPINIFKADRVVSPTGTPVVKPQVKITVE